ncbi:hypothetical protein L596_008499 [Steinernema carpocapsae]|uniref:Peptidase S8 pro-domain domain-containing protein n=1 Tax=Steinernema carpocapsae TaxID=34508 RepID=A0A4U5PCP2_STECR|nr:hypothetical protein L596_008499 [Steinernema carpocapsae]
MSLILASPLSEVRASGCPCDPSAPSNSTSPPDVSPLSKPLYLRCSPDQHVLISDCRVPSTLSNRIPLATTRQILRRWFGEESPAMLFDSETPSTSSSSSVDSNPAKSAIQIDRPRLSMKLIRPSQMKFDRDKNGIFKLFASRVPLLQSLRPWGQRVSGGHSFGSNVSSSIFTRISRLKSDPPSSPPLADAEIAIPEEESTNRRPWRRRSLLMSLNLRNFVFLLTILSVVGFFPSGTFATTSPSYERESGYTTPSFRRAYTNTWALRIDGGDPEKADSLAKKYGYSNLGPVIPGDEYFLFEKTNQRRRSSRKLRSMKTSYITREPEVKWMEQMQSKRRVKRGYEQPRPKRYDSGGGFLRATVSVQPRRQGHLRRRISVEEIIQLRNRQIAEPKP